MFIFLISSLIVICVTHFPPLLPAAPLQANKAHAALLPHVGSVQYISPLMCAFAGRGDDVKQKLQNSLTIPIKSFHVCAAWIYNISPVVAVCQCCKVLQ